MQKINGKDVGDAVLEQQAANTDAEKHTKAAAVDELERRMRERHAKQAAEAKTEEPVAQPSGEAPPPAAAPAVAAGPEVVGRMVIELFADGNVRIEGPYNDRVMFSWMLKAAADMELRSWLKSMALHEQAQARAAQQAASPAGKKHALRQMFGAVGKAFSGAK